MVYTKVLNTMLFSSRSDKIFLSAKDQIRKWRRASRKMIWKIGEEEFDSIVPFPGNDQLGLGIGNVDRIYPMFAVPSLKWL